MRSRRSCGSRVTALAGKHSGTAITSELVTVNRQSDFGWEYYEASGLVAGYPLIGNWSLTALDGYEAMANSRLAASMLC